MNYALWAVAALTVWGSLLTIAKVGKPREPITAPVAAASTLINAVIVTVIVLAAIRLH